MSNRRRIIIIAVSVLGGSFIAMWFISMRVGSLSPDNFRQLIFNFVFSLAIVIGIAILLSRMNKKDKQNNQDKKDD